MTEDEKQELIRQARAAISLIIGGAMRQIDSQFKENDPAIHPVCDELLANCEEEVDDWMRTDEPAEATA